MSKEIQKRAEILIKELKESLILLSKIIIKNKIK